MNVNPRYPGAPIVPTGNPMTEGLGPAAWADRPDEPDLTLEGEPKIVPMGRHSGYALQPWEWDPRGASVVGCDGDTAGRVTDIWVDRSEPQVRYLEVDLEGADGTALMPVGFAKVDKRRGRLTVKALKASHFRDIPRTRAPDRVTLLEEDRISAYFAGGYLYATPDRAEPLL